ncbi:MULTISPECIES: carboxyl transferase domain-containing protein [unclassified Pseudonocardia]|uniref:acetyl-CoA carboxylase family protein n=1 Tax=unclassified Pseudonocardia TaxID=2619320 RepID=UPI000962DB93|nr:MULTISPECIES: carboxyl transferase domain-containing protein [unclassified Pseudonocardia]OLL93357.1 Biotin carboxylase [Pseudonocardia sp. Ae356_Ps1]
MSGTLLVANRAEIAVRIMDTASALGIGTVAVHPADDAACLHVVRADRAVELPGAGAAAYLDVDRIVRAAVDTGADALHPGYGFLSENPALARACAAHGVTFVGPAPEALELFGDKASARERAAALGVPVLEAVAPDDGAALLSRLGPGGAVMVKARSGGGGRGMRPVTDAAHLDDAVRRCASEARTSFGDGEVLVERLLPRARHVEVQLLGDGTDVVVLGDRDCSAQRHRQKLVEIGPAPALPGDVRARLHDAALRLLAGYSGLATAEFLVAGAEIAFLEVNPRIQAEHTVTEETTGLDLVELGLRVARGARLADLGLTAPPVPRGTAVQARVNAEAVGPDGSRAPAAGTLTRFQPPAGCGIRVDTHGYAGYPVGPRYDPLLAKVVTRGADAATAAAAARRALAGFDVAGVEVNIGLLQALLALPELVDGTLDTSYVDRNVGGLAGAERESVLPPAGPADPSGTGAGPVASAGRTAVPEDRTAVRAARPGVVVALPAGVGDVVGARGEVVVLEAMKMEHPVTAGTPGRVESLAVAVGDAVEAGDLLAVLADADAAEDAECAGADDPDRIRPDLAEVRDRRRTGLDEGRAAAVARRRDAGRRTARENIADLLDPDSFVEYGALTLAAQRARRSVDELVAKTPADGLVTGTGTVGGRPVAVMSYDYTVLAGTQGVHNHHKTDRLFRLAERENLPVVVFAEGGGGRPGDTDTSAVAQLDVPTFRLFARLRGRVPTVAVVAGYCFAGNAALAGACDLIVATEGSSLGMGGPAMISGGGLGVVAPSDVGPMPMQWANGVVDLLVPDEAAAVAEARRYLLHVGGDPVPGEHADQRALRHAVPENRVRAYDVRRVLDVLFDTGSVVELRGGFGAGIVTAFARLDGLAVGVLANDPEHLGGAIDGDAADKATAFLQLCEARGLPVVSLCDTPGFMVGPDAERTATVRRFGAMFVAGAQLTVPLVAVVLRKGYGLGAMAMAMAGGDLHAPVLTVAWPTGEFGGMGLEGAVRLGYRDELAAIDDADARQVRYDELVAGYYERGKALSVATVFEIDDVIDPADTRTLLTRALGNRGR